MMIVIIETITTNKSTYYEPDTTHNFSASALNFYNNLTMLALFTFNS